MVRALKACLSALLAAVGGVGAAVAAPLPQIDPARLSALTRELASPDFAGRAPGTAGERKTLDLLIGAFKAAKLEPGAPDGGWTQAVPLLNTRLTSIDPIFASARSKRVPLSFPDDIAVSTSLASGTASIQDAPVVFVGYGAQAPERAWDDFKGADLRGKVLLFLVNDPDFEAAPGEDAHGLFAGKGMTIYGRWSHKFDEAARLGAAGALVIHEAAAAGYDWNVAKTGAGESYILESRSGNRRATFTGWLHQAAAERLLALGGRDLAALKRAARSRAFSPVDLGATLTIRASVQAERIVSHNVIGRISGAAAADEAILFGAHWDALGNDRPGAVDNAIGVAGLIELARGFAAGPRPRRSLIFAAWTAEERGLLGAEHYVANPSVPLDSIVANLTLDVLQTAGPAGNVILIGKGQSQLEDMLADAALAQGRAVTEEQYPERGLFYRSDHFSFVRRGVPAILMMGLAGGIDLEQGGAAAGDAWLQDYTRNCYHQPCDAWSSAWDLRGAAQDVDILRRIGERLAFGSEWPAWKDGSEFGRLRPARPARDGGAR